VQKAQATLKVTQKYRKKNLLIQTVPKSPFRRKMKIEQGGTQLARCISTSAATFNVNPAGAARRHSRPTGKLTISRIRSASLPEFNQRLP